MEQRVLKIDPEFRDKIPQLTNEEFQKLEENILSDGEVRDPIVVWNDTIIDGHNRWKIIQKHPQIPYRIKEMEFADKWAAVVWMCRNQLGRRNVTDEQKTVLIGEAYKAQKMSVGGDRGNQYKKVASHQNEDLPKTNRTAGKIAKQFNVGKATVERAEYFVDGLNAAEEVSPGFKTAILSGEVKAPKSTISEIRKMDPEEKKRTVKAIMMGESPVKKVESKPAKRPNNPGGFTKAERKLRDEIAAVAASMKDNTDVIVYTISDLEDDFRINAEAYIDQFKRTMSLHKNAYAGSDDNKKRVIAEIRKTLVFEIENVIKEIENA